MRAKFSELTYEAGGQKSCCASKGCGQVEPWLTAEGIPVKGAYTAEDLEGMEHLNYAAGIAPFLRGPYSTMYVMRPWTIRQSAGFSTAEESNAFYRRNLASGQKGLSVQITPPGIKRCGNGLQAAQQGQGGHIEEKKSHLSDSFVNLRQVPDGGMDVQPAAAEGLADSLDAVRRSAAAEQTLPPGSGVIRRQEVHPACHVRLP